MPQNKSKSLSHARRAIVGATLFLSTLTVSAVAFAGGIDATKAHHKAMVLPATLRVTTATAGTARTLADVAGKRATVIVFVGASCPITNQYAPELAKLAAHYNARGVAVLRVYAGTGATADTARTHGATYGLTGLPVLLDADGTLADALGATVTPEVFVLDAGRAVRYAGRIDDRFVDRGKSRTTGASTHDLTAAVDAVLAGKTIAVERTRAVGCAIERRSAAITPASTGAPITVASVTAAAGAPTYAHDVAAVLQKNCVSCHRAGEIGPMPLETYEQARKYATNIASITATKQMPPWKPVAGCGPFVGERRLSEDQIALLKNWASSGAPAGDLTKAPAEPEFPKGWTLGKPDLVLTIPTVWKTAADADEIYRCFVLPTNLTEDRDVVAVEYRPGNRSVVHHIIGYLDNKGLGRAKDGKDGKPGYTSFGGPGFMPSGEVGGWAPGNIPQFLPDGIGRRLPAGSDIVLQIHYHPTGKVEEDQTQIGLYFAKKPVTKYLRTLPLMAKLDIPADNADYQTGTTFTSPLDADIIAVTPHMHLLGRKFAMNVKQPDGATESLIKIDDWDFNWQGTYTYEKPVHISKGSVINLAADYDNSVGNARNPHTPPQHVGWGEKTTDEMCIGFISFIVQDENDPTVKMLDAILGGGGARKRVAQ